MNTIPVLEERFSEPEGWRWHAFKNKKGKRVRYGSVFPKDSIPDAIIVGLPGLDEFAEKYFEVARTLLSRNLAFWVIDWQGQGQSERSNGQHDFEDNISDLHQFLNDYVFPASVHPDRGRIARVMLGHSMGGNIGLRYMHQYPDSFLCSILSAPLIDIAKRSPLPISLSVLLLYTLFPFHRKPAPGYKNLFPDRRPEEADIFSSDEARRKIHNLWHMSDPSLKIDHVTIGWLQQVMKSCAKLQKKSVLKNIKTPTLIGIAGKESLVSNAAIKKAARFLPNAEILDLPEARHEILVETDEMRDLFFKAFDDFLNIHVLQKEERLKPF